MSKKFTKMFSDPQIAQRLVSRIHHISKKQIKIMEVCGTHTVSIFRSGIRSLLPNTIKLCSGPGCPVCVTSQKEIDIFILFAKINNVIIATFGDLIRVPGTFSSLQKEKADGADIRIIYSSFDAIDIARENPNKKVVFLGVGFETTAPTIAAAVILAKKLSIYNFYVVSTHKIVPPALEALAANNRVDIDGFILPGHVSVVIGMEAYRSFFNKHLIPCIIAGFESTDLLNGIALLVEQIETEKPKLENAYKRAVSLEGNCKAMELLAKVFDIVDAEWRGIGIIEGSGLAFNEEYSSFDAQKNFGIFLEKSSEPIGCSCGDVLMGIKNPPECKLYKNVCIPSSPVGPCMVSNEGTCAAYYRYNNEF